MGGVQDATKEKSATNAAGKQDREINDPPKSTEQLQTENEELRKSLNQKDRQLETAKGQMEEVQKAKESLSYEITNLKKKVKRMVDETKKKDDKISSLRGKIDQLSNGSKAEGGQKAGSKRKNADDSEDDDDGWDTGTPERRSSPVSAPVDHGELRKKLARVEQERDEAVKKLKLIKVSPGKGKSTATSSPGGGDEAKKEMYLNLLEAELREAKSDKEKALKFVIDMVGKKRFQSFLQEAQDLKSLKKIVRKKISGGGAMGATSSSGVRDISPVKAHQKSPEAKPRVGQGAWWSTRYMDEVQTEKSSRRGRGNHFSPPTSPSQRANMRRDRTVRDMDKYEEYKRYMQIAKMQSISAQKVKPPFMGGGRRQTLFSNLRDTKNMKIATVSSMNSVGKSAIMKAAEAYKEAAGWN